MLQFKIGDRVRINCFAPKDSGATGIVTQIHEHNAGALRLQEFEINFGAHSHSFLGTHLQHANEPWRLFCGEVVRKWPHLPHLEIEESRGDLAKIVALLQSTYGYSAERAKKELDSVVSEFCEKLRLAS